MLGKTVLYSLNPPSSLMNAAELAQSMNFLARSQMSSGMIPWFKGGKADPWNHAEVAIALALGGNVDAALAGADWLKARQNRDGSWCHFYQSSGVSEPRVDTNTCAYPVVLVALLDAIIDDEQLMAPYAQMAFSGIDLVVSHQRNDGSVPWAIDPGGSPQATSLVAGSASVVDSLMVASQLSLKYRPSRSSVYRNAAFRLRASLRHGGNVYRDTTEWAMDHYYPVLAGIGPISSQVEEFLDKFYAPGWGIRCRLPNEWFTAAESAESAIALHLIGKDTIAREIFDTLGALRCDDGGYLTGVVSPERKSYPYGEASTYSVAAVVIASFILADKALHHSIGAAIMAPFA